MLRFNLVNLVAWAACFGLAAFGITTMAMIPVTMLFVVAPIFAIFAISFEALGASTPVATVGAMLVPYLTIVVGLRCFLQWRALRPAEVALPH